MIGPGPSIDPAAVVVASSLGESVWIGPRALVMDSDLEGYARVQADAMVQHSDLARFATVSARARIGPVPHTHDGAAQHTVVTVPGLYGFDLEDDSAFLARRASNRTTLGPDSMVAHGAIVLPGVTLGAGALVGAGAVVTRDVPPFAVAVGNPARVVRYRHPPEVIEALLRVAWWNWPRERLAAALPDLRNLSAAQFCARYEPGCKSPA